MNPLRFVLRGLLGKRLPVVTGELTVPGLNAPVTIRREKHGIPLITATTDHDAWFALGFCHAQDRSAQLEILLRIGRGALCEIAGAAALPVDRLCRKVGFRRAAEQQLAAVSAEGKALLEAYKWADHGLHPVRGGPLPGVVPLQARGGFVGPHRPARTPGARQRAQEGLPEGLADESAQIGPVRPLPGTADARVWSMYHRIATEPRRQSRQGRPGGLGPHIDLGRR